MFRLVPDKFDRYLTGLFKPADQSKKLPDFLVIGAVKASTAACIQNLGKHPDIYVVTRKYKLKCFKHNISQYDSDYLNHGEIKFFSEPELFKKGINWYADFFSHAAHKIKGEKSPQYLYNYDNYNIFGNRTCDRIKEVLPEVKIIILLRDPVNRSFSEWNHIQDQLYKSSAKYHHRSFYDCITDTDGHNFILSNSEYYQNILDYLSVFGKENVYIAIQERILANMHKEYMKMFDFLGARRKMNIDFNIIHKRNYKNRTLDNKSLEYLKQYYREDVRKLKELLDDDLPEWRDY